MSSIRSLWCQTLKVTTLRKRAAPRRLLRSALQGEREMGAVDDHKKGGEDREHPAAREPLRE